MFQRPILDLFFRIKIFIKIEFKMCGLMMSAKLLLNGLSRTNDSHFIKIQVTKYERDNRKSRNYLGLKISGPGGNHPEQENPQESDPAKKEIRSCKRDGFIINGAGPNSPDMIVKIHLREVEEFY